MVGNNYDYLLNFSLNQNHHLYNQNIKQTHQPEYKPSKIPISYNQNMSFPPPPPTIGPYAIHNMLSSGSEGEVFYATRNNQPYAIKRISKKKAFKRSKSRLDKSIKAMYSISHENIIKLFDVLQDNSSIYLVMEYCEQDLASRMEKSDQIQERDALEILKDIINGYKQLWNRNIFHRDLKPQNLLISKGVVKIGDFGLMRTVMGDDDYFKSYVGTPAYMSPQILESLPYTNKSDIWSLGMIFYQLIFRCLPWNCKNTSNLLKNIKSIPLSLPPKPVTDFTQNLLRRMLQIDAKKRITWSELFQAMDINLQNEKSLRNTEVMVVKNEWMLKLMRMQLKRMSQVSFGVKFECLKKQDKKSVINLALKLFKKEHQDYCLQAIKNDLI